MVKEVVGKQTEAGLRGIKRLGGAVNVGGNGSGVAGAAMGAEWRWEWVA